MLTFIGQITAQICQRILKRLEDQHVPVRHVQMAVSEILQEIRSSSSMNVGGDQNGLVPTC